MNLRLAMAMFALSAFMFAGPARADETTRTLERAAQALGAGQHQKAITLARQIAARPSLPRADRAEAYRLLALASFFADDRTGAKGAFFEFIRLDADAHLDPALVPPEVIVLLEEVRAERAAELAAQRPTQRKRGALNLLPPLGQFQNGESTKGWVIGGVWVGLLATNLTTFGVLSAWCEGDGTCPGHDDSARALRVVNLVAGVGAAGAFVYGIVDGYWVMKKQQRERRDLSVGAVPVADGAAFVLSGRF